MTRAAVFGAGMVGQAIAMDLAGDFDVTVVDKRPDALARAKQRAKVSVREADLGNPEVARKTAGEFDLVVGALSSHLGLQTLRAVIEAGRAYCDISFMAEDAT